MPYLPNTDDDRRAMLKKIGVDNFEELLSNIPDEVRLNRPLDIPAVSEMELMAELEQLSQSSSIKLINFAGGGLYDHFIPAAVGAIISRPEFMTAYTPYQAEVSQGTLQVIYEFQTHICRLTGMEVANASMYDGASAAAEAIILSTAVTKRNKVLVSEALSPLYREVIATYLSGRRSEVVNVPLSNGTTDLKRLKELLDDQTACVLIGQPNFFGLLEEADQVADLTHAVGAKLIMSVDPIAQALIKTPGDVGADIVVGEGQPLGLSLNFGGPLLGFFAARKKLIRYVPGRIVGRTKDVDGLPGFVLTLQTREQHIRREKATSNICTNQALCATAASVYMSLLGKQGLKRVALLSAEKAQKTRSKLLSIDGVEPYFDRPFVREFPIRIPVSAQQLVIDMAERGILAGVAAGRWYREMDNCLIIALTEKRTDQEIDKLCETLKEMTANGIMSRVQQ